MNGIWELNGRSPLDVVEILRHRELEWSEEFNVRYRRTLKLRLVFGNKQKPVISSINVLGTAEAVQREAEKGINYGIRATCELPDALDGANFALSSAVKGDKNLALQALLIDEMAILPDRAEKMLEELLAASKDLLPQFNDNGII